MTYLEANPENFEKMKTQAMALIASPDCHAFVICVPDEEGVYRFEGSDGEHKFEALVVNMISHAINEVSII